MADFDAVDDFQMLSLDDGCYCNSPINDDKVGRQVLAGCEKMMDCSEELEDLIHDILEETVVNYYNLSGSAIARCSLTNQFTRNYDFLSKNVSLISDLNHCCSLVRVGNDTKTANEEMRRIYKLVMRGIFPGRFGDSNGCPPMDHLRTRVSLLLNKLFITQIS